MLALGMCLGGGLALGDDAASVRVALGALVLEAPQEVEATLRQLADEATTLLPQLENELGVAVRAPFLIVLIPRDRANDAELERLDSMAPPWAAGFLLAEARVGAIRLAQVNRYPYDDLPMVLAHEVAHMLMADGAGGAPLPRWFEEGTATHLGRRWGLRDLFVHSSALLVGKLPSLEALDRSFSGSSMSARRAYAASFDFVSWSLDRYGDSLLPEILRAMPQQSFEEAWQQASGSSLADSEAAWRRHTVFFYRWLPILTGSGTLWMVITSLALVAFVRRRRRTRRLYEQWDWEDGAAAIDDELVN